MVEKDAIVWDFQLATRLHVRVAETMLRVLIEDDENAQCLGVQYISLTGAQANRPGPAVQALNGRHQEPSSVPSFMKSLDGHDKDIFSAVALRKSDLWPLRMTSELGQDCLAAMPSF